MSVIANVHVSVYACPSCGRVTCDPVEDEYGDRYCPEEDCSAFLEARSYRDASYVTIAVYEVSRVYGGAEDGGWYYDHGCLITGTQRSFLAEDGPQADVYLGTMLHRWKNDYRSDIRYQVRVWAEEDAPKKFPKITPYYC